MGTLETLREEKVPTSYLLWDVSYLFEEPKNFSSLLWAQWACSRWISWRPAVCLDLNSTFNPCDGAWDCMTGLLTSKGLNHRLYCSTKTEIVLWDFDQTLITSHINSLACEVIYKETLKSNWMSSRELDLKCFNCSCIYTCVSLNFFCSLWEHEMLV